MNTELMLLQGYSNLFTSVFTETLIGSSNWFTQSLRSGPLAPLAFGQVEEFQQRARINWLLDINRDSREMLPRLIDNLGFEAGLRGSRFLCASADPGSPMFETLRKAGYCSYGWERFWQIKPDYGTAANPSAESFSEKYHWAESSSMDIHDLKKFQNKHLSPAVRAVTPLANEALPEYVLKKDGVIFAYARVNQSGSKGLIQPTIASDLQDQDAVLMDLLRSLNKNGFTWFFLQSANHDSMDEVLNKISVPITEKIELMVNHFTIMEKSPVRLMNHSTENGHPDPVAPFMNTSRSQDNL